VVDLVEYAGAKEADTMTVRHMFDRPRKTGYRLSSRSIEVPTISGDGASRGC
jgi:hypothetical protein